MQGGEGQHHLEPAPGCHRPGSLHALQAGGRPFNLQCMQATRSCGSFGYHLPKYVNPLQVQKNTVLLPAMRQTDGVDQTLPFALSDKLSRVHAQ